MKAIPRATHCPGKLSQTAFEVSSFMQRVESVSKEYPVGKHIISQIQIEF